jgi:hypothetical protein
MSAENHRADLICMRAGRGIADGMTPRDIAKDDRQVSIFTRRLPRAG